MTLELLLMIAGSVGGTIWWTMSFVDRRVSDAEIRISQLYASRVELTRVEVRLEALTQTVEEIRDVVRDTHEMLMRRSDT